MRKDNIFDDNSNEQFKPALHETMVDLCLFSAWLKKKLLIGVVEEALMNPNVQEALEAIEAIAGGMDI